MVTEKSRCFKTCFINYKHKLQKNINKKKENSITAPNKWEPMFFFHATYLVCKICVLTALCMQKKTQKQKNNNIMLMFWKNKNKW